MPIVENVTQVTRYTCDNPDCEKEVLTDTPEDIIGWYFGSVIHHHLTGGDGGDWVACSKKCIQKAVLEVIFRKDYE